MDTNGFVSSPSSPAIGRLSPSSVAVALKASSMETQSNNVMTPKKSFLDSLILREIRKQLNSPGGCDIQSLQWENSPSENLNVIKDRYLLSSAGPSIKDNFTDISSLNNLKCLDIYTEENFLCKIVNEQFDKVQAAYFQVDDSISEEYGHKLIREVRDIIPLSKNRTYVIIPLDNGYENLHTYIREKKRLSEEEAHGIYRQICETMRACHNNGIILRDLKLKRFYFLDKERTQIQYESLEGSIILNNPEDDILYEKIGCPLYTAPELLTPNSTFQGKPADMWSLGVILFTMLLGQYPFNEKNGHSLFINIRNHNIVIPNALSGKARCLIRSLLRRNPEERLIADDIFSHPWMKFLPKSIQCNEQKYEVITDDHCVPEVPSVEIEDDVEMG